MYKYIAETYINLYKHVTCTKMYIYENIHVYLNRNVHIHVHVHAYYVLIQIPR